MKGGRPAKTDGGIVTMAPMTRAQAERRRARGTSYAGSARLLAGRRARICSPAAAGSGARLGGRLRLARRRRRSRGNAEDDRDHAPTATIHQLTTTPTRRSDADREADRPDARCAWTCWLLRRSIRSLVNTCRSRSGRASRIQPARQRRVNDVTVGEWPSTRVDPRCGTAVEPRSPYSRQRRSTSSLDLAAHLDLLRPRPRVLLGHLCVASMPILPP